MLDWLGAVSDLNKAILVAAGFPDPDAVGRTQRRASSLDPLGLLERIHGEILAGNLPLAAETVRLGTNAVRTLVRRGELSADESEMIVAELRAAI